jgi:hypothetical protein
MLTHYEDTGGKELRRATTPHMVTTGWQETELESLPHIRNNTLTIPGQMGPPENSAPYTMDSGIADDAAQPTMSNRVGDKRKIPLSDGEIVVLRKKRRVRGKGRGQRKLQIQWATRTIPCAFSDRLTPATVITDVGAHMEVLDTVILKMTLSSNRLAMLQRDTPLSEQGIVAGGDTISTTCHYHGPRRHPTFGGLPCGRDHTRPSYYLSGSLPHLPSIQNHLLPQ